MSQKHRDLVNELLDRTKNKRLAWEPTAEANEFVASFLGKFSCVLGRKQELFGDTYWLSVLDREERELFNLSSNHDDGTSLPHLYSLARSIALRVEESLDEILRELKGE